MHSGQCGYHHSGSWCFIIAAVEDTKWSKVCVAECASSLGPKVHDHIDDRRTLTRMNCDQLPSPEDSNFLDLNADTIY